jgi:hypothetical protein
VTIANRIKGIKLIAVGKGNAKNQPRDAKGKKSTEDISKNNPKIKQSLMTIRSTKKRAFSLNKSTRLDTSASLSFMYMHAVPKNVIHSCNTPPNSSIQ